MSGFFLSKRSFILCDRMDKKRYVCYEDEWCYYIWKPAGQHTTFWHGYSFLEELSEQRDDQKIFEILQQGEQKFWKKEEYWLLNRLDTLTMGLLYFAKSPEIKKQYKRLQAEGRVKKKYLLEVRWDIGYRVDKYGKLIDFPIAHHKFSADRMVVVSSDMVLHKIKGALHNVKTVIEEYCYNKATKTTVVLVTIEKWIRHQIRSHFSDIGYPLVGDPLYGKKKDPYYWSLQLMSVGVKIEEEER